MKKRIFKEENYKLSKWSGGSTRELAIYPANAEYLDRDFLWRLSSADSDKEESSFTKLPVDQCVYKLMTHTRDYVHSIGGTFDPLSDEAIEWLKQQIEQGGKHGQ